MMRSFIVLCLLSLMIENAHAAYEWQRAGSLTNLRCGNYCDITGHQGRLYAADSNNGTYATGDMWLSISGSLTSYFSGPLRTIRRSDLSGYFDRWGQPATYVRTVGLASDGISLHALLHVGAAYGSPNGYYFVPAYATSNDGGISWRYDGPVSVEGESARQIFSSSMAYLVQHGIHYMVQDAGAYGYGGLVAFRSNDGRNWQKIGGDITAVSTDRPVFPDLAFHDGRYHLVYENGWQHDGDKIRHLSSADMINWRVEQEKISPSSWKGINIFSYDGELYGHINGQLWQAVDDNAPEPIPEPELEPFRISGLEPVAQPADRDVTVRWNANSGQVYSIKLVGPVNNYRDVLGGSHTYRNLPPGDYLSRIRPKGGEYANARFRISPSGSNDEADGPLQPRWLISGRSVTLSWLDISGPVYSVKLVGPTSDYRDVRSTTHTYNNLASGEYKARVRPKGGTYSDTYFRIR